MKKKAQITIYIIFGIIILTAIGSTIYLTGRFKLNKSQITPQPNTLQNYIQNCLYQTAQDALTQLGEHGGYINPTNIALTKKTFNFDTNPTESDALYLSYPNKSPVIYWWHLKSKKDCKECTLTAENKPTLNDEITQVQDYVTQELPNCLNNFEPFLKQAYHISTENKTTTVIATENDVKIMLTMPTTISKSGIQTKINSFETSIDIPLKKIYTLASQITNDEIEQQRIEDLFLHQLATYSDVDPSKLPPLSAITQTPNTITWTKQLVEQNVKQLLVSMTPLITLNNTKKLTKNLPKNILERGNYQAMTYNIQNVSNPDTTVSFDYFDQPIYFNIGPASQNKLLPDIDRTTFPLDLAPPFQTNYYEFFYDISAPILTQIKATKALNGQGYTFNFGLEINIRRNKNMAQYYFGQGTISSWDSTTLQPNITTTNYNFTPCQQLTQNNYKCPLNNQEYNETKTCTENCYTNTTQTTTTKINKTFFCNQEQKISGTIKIITTDATTKKPVQNAATTYICGKQLACQIGTTNERGTLLQKFPICYNGLLKISANNYQPNTQLLTTQPDKRDQINTELEQIKTINLSIKKLDITISANETKQCCTQDNLNTFEKVTLTFEKIKENPLDNPFTTFTNYNPQQQNTIDITPGKYQITANLIDTLGFAIPKACKSICTNTDKNNGCTQWTFYPEEDQYYKPVILGGIKIDNETGYLNIDRNTLEKTKTLQINIIKIPTPTCTDTINCLTPNCVGLDELGKIARYSKDFKEQLIPQITT